MFSRCETVGVTEVIENKEKAIKKTVHFTNSSLMLHKKLWKSLTPLKPITISSLICS